MHAICGSPRNLFERRPPKIHPNPKFHARGSDMVRRLEKEHSSYPQNPSETEQVKQGKGPQQGRASVQPDAPKNRVPKRSAAEPAGNPKRRRR
jgi:hypothetical protein